jgi:3-keto-disaccharide hydrolase
MNCSSRTRLFLLTLMMCPLLAAGAADSATAGPPVTPPALSNAPQFGTIQLFNGRNLDGLHVFLTDPAADPAKTWTVKDGVLQGTGTPLGYIRTQMAYADYRLHVEWRWPGTPGNSGVVMHIVNRDELWPKGFEVNMLAGQAGSFALFWDARSKEANVGRIANRFSTGRLVRHAPESIEKAPGEWNAMDIVADGDTITVMVNGVEVNRMTGVTPSGGLIALQSEGAAIEFRNWTLTPLPAQKDLVTQVPSTR